MSLFFIRNATPLSEGDIITLLKKLRAHAEASYSYYHVATVMEVKLDENMYCYTSGVNIEIAGHHRLSIHGEQNALASALALLGEDKKFSRAWIMAAPASAEENTDHRPGKSCGHCRQIMCSFAEKGCEIYTVTLAGKISLPDSFDRQFLPDSFSESDLKITVPQATSSLCSFRNQDTTFFHSSTLNPWDLIGEVKELPTGSIAQYLKAMTPHVISKAFLTSPITACIMRCNNGYYAPGILVQDIAFLTTDAIFAAIGNAITRFSSKGLLFDEIHLASSHLNPAQFSLTEIGVLASQYIHQETIVHVYALGKQASYRFEECIKASNQAMVEKIKKNRVVNDKEMTLSAKL